MSWYSRVCVFLASLLITATASAQRIDFGGPGSVASLETRVLTGSRGENQGVVPVEISLSIPGMDVEEAADGFNRVQVAGLTPMDIVGNPELLGAGSLVAVPEGYTPELTLVQHEEREVENVTVQPTQRKYRCDCPKNELFVFNSALYASNAVYPANVAELEEVGSLQGLHLVRVALHPIQMEMGKKALKITTRIVARVDFRQTARSAPVVLSRSFFQIARSVAANGKALGQMMQVSRGPERMLILVADSLKSDIAPLVAWKQSRGLHVEVVTLSQMGTTNEDVKKYLQKYYASQDVKPSYLLFVGDKESMPTYMQDTSSGSAATDYPYSLLTRKDSIPDVLYGRLVAHSADDVKVQIDRWIDYEKSPDRGASWYSQGTTIASNQGSSPSDKEYAQQIQSLLKAGSYKGVDGFYQGEETATFSKISDALSQGRTWLSYFGHGSGTSWGSTNDTFNVEAVSRLNNQGKLPVIIDVACLNASWVDIKKPFGLAWVTATADGKNTGAVGFLGGSVSVSWTPPAVMSVGIAKYHFAKPVYTFGGSFIAGQLYLIEQMGTGSDVTDNLKWYNLLGDPSLVMRTDTPKAYQVKKSLSRSTNGLMLNISATTPEGKGVAGLTASISPAEGAPLAVAQTNANGEAAIPLPSMHQLEPNTKLTTTGYNAETVETLVQ